MGGDVWIVYEEVKLEMEVVVKGMGVGGWVVDLV